MMTKVIDFEENDLSFASILLGFRESSDSQDCEDNIRVVGSDSNQASVFSDDSLCASILCNPLVNQWEGIASIGQRNNQKSTSPRNDTEQALHAGLYKTQGKGKENSGGQKQKQSHQKLPPETKKVNYEKQRREIEGKHLEKQRSPHSSEEILTDQQLQKFQRGRYKCSRCGALKTNHDCPIIEEYAGSRTTQIERIILTPQEFYRSSDIVVNGEFEGSLSALSSSPTSSSSSSADTGLRVLRTITVRTNNITSEANSSTEPSASVPVYLPPPSISSSSPKRSGDKSQLSSFMSDEMTTTDSEQSSTTSSLENATSDFGPKKIKIEYDDDPTIYE